MTPPTPEQTASAPTDALLIARAFLRDDEAANRGAAEALRSVQHDPAARRVLRTAVQRALDLTLTTSSVTTRSTTYSPLARAGPVGDRQ